MAMFNSKLLVYQRVMINTSKNGDFMAFHDDIMGFRISLDFKQNDYGIFHGIATR